MSLYSVCACVCVRVYLFSEQYGGVAVLLAGLWAQSDKPEQEQSQTGAPDHQLPVIVTLEEGLVNVEQLEVRQNTNNIDTISLLNLMTKYLYILKQMHLPGHNR